MIIGICEDNEIFREELRKRIELQNYNIPFQIYEYGSGEDMLLDKKYFDIVFLDIELKSNLSGIEVARQLQYDLPDLIIIFISGYTKYISSALHLRTFQFLLKPLDDVIFQEEFARCISCYRNEHDLFHIYQDGETIDIEMKDIVYINSNKRKLIIYDRRGKVYEMYGKISEQEENLEIHSFVRIHKSYIVNCRYIKKMKKEVVWLSGTKAGELISLPISRRCKEKAQKMYQTYLLGVKK